MSLFNTDGSLKTVAQLRAEQDRRRAKFFAGEHLQRLGGAGKPYEVEGVGFDRLLDAHGYAALCLRRSGLRYAWLLDRTTPRPYAWVISARGLEPLGEL